MSAENHTGARGELLGRVLYDVAQLLESADGADERVRRVLALIRSLVPYDQCALLEAGLDLEPRLVLLPETPLDRGAPLLGALLDLFGQLVPNSRMPAPGPPRFGGEHLAVPLVGLDQVIGLLFVQWSGEYTEEHLRGLSVVAAKLAAYLTTLRSRRALGELARERDESRRAAESASRTKDDLLRLLAQELKTSLGAILASADIVRSAVDDLPLRIRAIEELERSVRAQTALIDDILGQANVMVVGARSDLVDLPRPSGGRADDRTLAGVRVLLLEHDLGVRESVEAALLNHGAEVIAVGTAPEALAALDRSRSDVLLLGDLPLGGETVYDLMREMTARARPLPVASISAWRLDERQREREAGFQLHLTKPLEVGALVDAVAELAGRKDFAASCRTPRGSR